MAHTELIELTKRYALDPENPELNFDMAYQYHSLGQTASAFTHYLRCAERVDDDTQKDLAYEAMVRSYYCFEGQGRREFTARHILKTAQMILPRRPEAYYLLGMHHVRRAEHAEAYCQFSLALEFCDFDHTPLRTFVGYKGIGVLMFEKAKAAWEWDRNDESREILCDLLANYWDTVTDPQDIADIQADIARVGLTKGIHQHVKYNKEDHEKLKFKFPGSEDVVINGSQVFQDLFILYMTQGKKDGTFLEIGAADPYYGNNTALMEENYNWRGVGVEIEPEHAQAYNQTRKSLILFDDALKVDYEKVLKENFDTNVIDYLQLDLEPAENTFNCMLNIPFEDYKFRVITYEHDHYVDFTNTFRKKSRRYLKSFGYELVIADVSGDGQNTFEDWWVHPDLVDRELIENIKHLDGICNIKTHLLGE